jgi:predicted double-glycine peptidase
VDSIRKSWGENSRSDLSNFPFRVFVCGILALWACGCSSVRPFRGMAVEEESVLITSLPPLLQSHQWSCGPTCIAAVSSYWQKDFVKLAGMDRGTLANRFNGRDLAGLAETNGIRAFTYVGSIDDLEKNLQHGRPIIVLLRKPEPAKGLRFFENRWPVRRIIDLLSPHLNHWVVVIGYTTKQMIIHDPDSGGLRIDRKTFEQWWKQKRFTCLLLSPA